MPFVQPGDMLSSAQLPGWSGRFVHSEHMTFAHWEIDSGAAPLHEHRHEQEEVWHIVEGELALSIAGDEVVLGAGSVAVVPPHTPHSARPLGPCRAIVADYPLRTSLPGVSTGG
jgi:mannose-6-phosphate isomerase-like protein (cupin superfamily)